MVPPNELQIDIFVTNAKPMMSALNARRIPADTLAPPTPRFVIEDVSPRTRSEKKGHSPSSSIASSDTEDEDGMVDLSYYESDVANEERGELGHDEHILDLTNFEDDDDTALPGEAALSLAVREEGKQRRSIWRRTMALGGKHEADPRASFYGTGARSSMHFLSEGPATPAMQSLALPAVPEASSSRVQLHMSSPLSASTVTPTSAHPLLGEGASHFTFPPTSTRPTSPPGNGKRVSFAQSRAESPRPESALSHFSDTHSLAALVHEAAAEEKIRLDLGEEDLVDISMVADRARGGRPNFHKILADEVEQSKGSVIVGCECQFSWIWSVLTLNYVVGCGPTSLNAVVRKSIAAQINPARVRQGDCRGQISLIAEDFGY